MTSEIDKKNLLSKKSVESILRKYPDRIPILVYPIDNKQPQIDKSKYLVPKDMILAQFITIIRNRLVKLKPDEAIFVFVNGSTIPRASDTMSELYTKYKSEDEFLFIHYSLENTFG